MSCTLTRGSRLPVLGHRKIQGRRGPFLRRRGVQVVGSEVHHTRRTHLCAPIGRETEGLGTESPTGPGPVTERERDDTGPRSPCRPFTGLLSDGTRPVPRRPGGPDRPGGGSLVGEDVKVKGVHVGDRYGSGPGARDPSRVQVTGPSWRVGEKD